ncbi:hypothetical protein Cadr_000002419 [Camelus dromedarius]|uniref:Uncharacterized protein n=1 Tax=Camelus dromedarius TaxID=9838 RepID=A0A5N4EF25_CAMDR|nr:hypothetical protein Cadr_000002419 [Camelus dromedarius]
MASLGSRGQNDPPWCRWGGWGDPRSTWLVQGHSTSEEGEPGLNLAVSSELGPWLHPGLPRAVGCTGLVSLCMDMVWGERGPWGDWCKEEAWVRGPQEVTSLPWQ